MVKEISLLITDGKQSAEFEHGYREIASIIRRQPGYIFDELLHVIENPDEYFIIIHWESVEAHKKFVDSRDFPLVADTWGLMQREATVRHCRVVETAS